MNALVTASEQMVIMMIMIFIEGDIKMIKYINEMCEKYKCDIQLTFKLYGELRIVVVANGHMDYLMIDSNTDENTVKRSIEDTIRRCLQ